MVETTTLIVLLAVALVVMSVVVGALVVRLIHKNNELKEKNDVIVREVRRNQTLIDRAVQQGVSRAAMLSFSLLLLVGSVSVLTSCTKDDDTIYVPDPTDAPSTSPLVTVVYSPDAQRGFFKLSGITAGDKAAGVSSFVLDFGDGEEATGIGNLTVNSQLSTLNSDTWYTLDGRRLSGKPAQKGIYINNGKKIVIK